MKTRFKSLKLVAVALSSVMAASSIAVGEPADDVPVSPAPRPHHAKPAAVVTTQPATVTVSTAKTTPSDILSAVEQDGTVRLSVLGVAQTGDADGILVFLNKPDANVDTPATNDHFVGAAAFGPKQGNQPQSFTFNMVDSLKKLQTKGKLDLSKPLEITIVATAIEPKTASQLGKITIREVMLTVPSKK